MNGKYDVHHDYDLIEHVVCCRTHNDPLRGSSTSLRE